MRFEHYTLEAVADSRSADDQKLVGRWLEPALLVGMAPVVVFSERAPLAVVQLALALLLIPPLLRKVTHGYFLVNTPALLPLTALLAVALPLAIWVTPVHERFVWAEALRLVWSVAVLLAVIHWVFPADATVELTPDLTIDLTTELTADDTPEVASAVRVDRQGRLPNPLIGLTTVYLLIGVIFTISSLLILRSADKLPLLTALAERLPRLYSFWLNGFFNNEIGGIVLLFLPFVTALLLGVNKVSPNGEYDWLRQACVKGVLLLLLLLFGAALLLAQSRAAWIGAALSLPVMLTLLGRRGWVLLIFLGTMAIMGLIAIGPTRLLDELTVGSDVKTTDEIVTGILADRNLSARFLIWQRALHGIADAPLTGMGLLAFRVVAREPYAPLAGYQIDPDIHHAHNLFLQIGLDFGLPGLFAFLLLLLIATTALVRCYRQTPSESPMRTWVAGLAASLLAYLIYSLFDTVTLGAQRGVAFWFLLGLCLAAGELRLSKPKLVRQGGPITQTEARLRYDLLPPAHFLPVANDGAMKQTGHSWEYPTWVYITEEMPHKQKE